MALTHAIDSGPIGVGRTQRRMSRWVSEHLPILLLCLLLVLLPAVVSNFVLVQIVGWTLILGMIALSLMFLAGYGGGQSGADDRSRRCRIYDYGARSEFASLLAINYYNSTDAVLKALDQVNGDLSDNNKKFRGALKDMVLDAPNGRITLDENRQAIGTNCYGSRQGQQWRPHQQGCEGCAQRE
jgi:hypothetical protein